MTELWCVRIPANDELLAMTSKRYAEKFAAEHNEYIKEFYRTQKEPELKRNLLPEIENIKALVELWPYDEISHARNLRQQL